VRPRCASRTAPACPLRTSLSSCTTPCAAAAAPQSGTGVLTVHTDPAACRHSKEGGRLHGALPVLGQEARHREAPARPCQRYPSLSLSFCVRFLMQSQRAPRTCTIRRSRAAAWRATAACATRSWPTLRCAGRCRRCRRWAPPLGRPWASAPHALARHGVDGGCERVADDAGR
jgi:hypothetical protein